MKPFPRSLAAALAVLAASACGWNPFAAETRGTGDLLDVRVAVEVSPRELAPGDTAFVVVTASNSTDRTLRVSGGGCSRRSRFAPRTGALRDRRSAA